MKNFHHFLTETDERTGKNIYAYLHCSQKFNEISFEYIGRGQSVLPIWNQSIKFKFFGKNKQIPDIPFCDNNFVAVSEKALNCLLPLVEDCVEVVPLNVVNTDLKYFGLNVMKFYEIDRDRSTCSFYRDDDGQILSVNFVTKYAFRDDILPDANIFRAGTYNWIFVSEEIYRIAEENHLTGLAIGNYMKIHTGPLVKSPEWLEMRYR